MEKIICKKCLSYCQIRKTKRRDKSNPDILIHGEIIYHVNGDKEFREYGRSNTQTNQIVSLELR